MHVYIQIVCGGSRGGSLKFWNLSESKCISTQTGHRASIRTIDFHPYGNFLASGSLDTNIKIWDLRNKGCMQTYKGHEGNTIITIQHFNPKKVREKFMLYFCSWYNVSQA